MGYLRGQLTASPVIYGIDYALIWGEESGGWGGEADTEKAHSAFLGLLADVVHTCGKGARTETPR